MTTPTDLSDEDLATLLEEGVVDDAIVVMPRENETFCFPTTTTTNLEESILSRLGSPIILSAVVAATTTRLMVANAPSGSITFAVNYPPGHPFGFTVEPTFSIPTTATLNQYQQIGCRVYKCIPGYARQSGVQEGDILLEINDQPCSHLPYNVIVNQLCARYGFPRKILFLQRPKLLVNKAADGSSTNGGESAAEPASAAPQPS